MGMGFLEWWTCSSNEVPDPFLQMNDEDTALSRLERGYHKLVSDPGARQALADEIKRWTHAEYDWFHLVRFVDREVADRIITSESDYYTGPGSGPAVQHALKLFSEPGEKYPPYENYEDIAEVCVLRWRDLNLVMVGRQI